MFNGKIRSHYFKQSKTMPLGYGCRWDMNIRAL